MAKSEAVESGVVSPETDVAKWTFKDGTVQDVKLEEHSVWFGFRFFVLVTLFWGGGRGEGEELSMDWFECFCLAKIDVD